MVERRNQTCRRQQAAPENRCACSLFCFALPHRHEPPSPPTTATTHQQTPPNELPICHILRNPTRPQQALRTAGLPSLFFPSLTSLSGPSPPHLTLARTLLTPCRTHQTGRRASASTPTSRTVSHGPSRLDAGTWDARRIHSITAQQLSPSSHAANGWLPAASLSS
jgi:hypothetical protein